MIKKEARHLLDQAIGKFIEFSMPPTHEEVVAMNRSLFPENPKRYCSVESGITAGLSKDM